MSETFRWFGHFLWCDSIFSLPNLNCFQAQSSWKKHYLSSMPAHQQAWHSYVPYRRRISLYKTMSTQRLSSVVFSGYGQFKKGKHAMIAIFTHTHTMKFAVTNVYKCFTDKRAMEKGSLIFTKYPFWNPNLMVSSKAWCICRFITMQIHFLHTWKKQLDINHETFSPALILLTVTEKNTKD